MINPNYTETRVLFVEENCPMCALWKKFIRQFNMKLRPEKRIKIIDCTYHDRYDILTDPIIKLYEDKIDGYPILFIGDSRKDGAESITECKAWLFARLFNDFIFQQRNEMLHIIKKPLLFNKTCKYSQGRLICE